MKSNNLIYNIKSELEALESAWIEARIKATNAAQEVERAAKAAKRVSKLADTAELLEAKVIIYGAYVDGLRRCLKRLTKERGSA